MVRVTLTLIGANVVVFLLQIAFAGFTPMFALAPDLAFSGAWWQFFTYMFLHGGPMHIAINMFILFLFGEIVERALGWFRYLTLYIVSGLGSAVIYIILTFLLDPSTIGTQMLGASGAVFGIMAAYGLMFPKEKIWIPFFYKPLPAFTVIIVFAIIEFTFGFFGLEQGIANFGHLGGIITGAFMTWYWKSTTRPRNVHERRKFEFYWE